MAESPKYFEDNKQSINDLKKIYGRRSLLLSVLRFVTFLIAVIALIVAIVKSLVALYITFAVSFIAFIVLAV